MNEEIYRVVIFKEKSTHLVRLFLLSSYFLILRDFESRIYPMKEYYFNHNDLHLMLITSIRCVFSFPYKSRLTILFIYVQVDMHFEHVRLFSLLGQIFIILTFGSASGMYFKCPLCLYLSLTMA